MRIIKEQTERPAENPDANPICVIRTDTYARTLSHLLGLFDIAKGDFPGLKPEDVNVNKYAGSRYAKTYGIEFQSPEGATIPDDYTQIATLEPY